MKWLTNMDKTSWMNMGAAYMMSHFCGRPKATEKHSVEELESWGMVGIYECY